MKLHKYLDVQRQGYRNDKGTGRGLCRITDTLGLISHIGGGGYFADYIQSFIVTGKRVILLDLA